MTRDEMAALIGELKPGEKIRITLANRPADENFKGNLYWFLAMCLPDNNSLQMQELGRILLKCVADSGRFEGNYEYPVTILQGFDASQFVSKMIWRDVVHRIDRM